MRHINQLKDLPISQLSDAEIAKVVMYRFNSSMCILVFEDPEDKKVLYFQRWKNQLGKTHVEKVDWLRQEIGSVIKDIKPLFNTAKLELTREMSISRTNTYNHLCEARFHLGFELQRIKENR